MGGKKLLQSRNKLLLVKEKFRMLPLRATKLDLVSTAIHCASLCEEFSEIDKLGYSRTAG